MEGAGNEVFLLERGEGGSERGGKNDELCENEKGFRSEFE